MGFEGSQRTVRLCRKEAYVFEGWEELLDAVADAAEGLAGVGGNGGARRRMRRGLLISSGGLDEGIVRFGMALTSWAYVQMPSCSRNCLLDIGEGCSKTC